MKHTVLATLFAAVILFVSCGKTHSQDSKLPEYYLLSSDVLSLEQETTNAGALTNLHLTLTEEAGQRMGAYLQAGSQSATPREISLIGSNERVQMVMTSPVDSRMYTPFWYILPDIIVVPTESLPAILSVLNR